MEEPEVLLFGGSGWVRMSWPERPYRVLAHTEAREGRRVITELVIRSTEHIDSVALKGLPIGWIEGVLNTPQAHEKLSAADGTDDRLGLVLTELDLVTAEMTAKPASSLAAPGVPREPLQRPDGSDPDMFYRQVAEAYMDILRRTSAIAPVIAKEADVPVGTARRWIQEARRRGFLAPARRGRAG